VPWQPSFGTGHKNISQPVSFFLNAGRTITIGAAGVHFRLSEQAPSKRCGPEDGEYDQSNHPQVFFFHGLLPPLLAAMLL
jgi:hypothetical protein